MNRGKCIIRQVCERSKIDSTEIEKASMDIMLNRMTKFYEHFKKIRDDNAETDNNEILVNEIRSLIKTFSAINLNNKKEFQPEKESPIGEDYIANDLSDHLLKIDKYSLLSFFSKLEEQWIIFKDQSDFFNCHEYKKWHNFIRDWTELLRTKFAGYKYNIKPVHLGKKISLKEIDGKARLYLNHFNKEYLEKQRLVPQQMQINETWKEFNFHKESYYYKGGIVKESLLALANDDYFFNDAKQMTQDGKISNNLPTEIAIEWHKFVVEVKDYGFEFLNGKPEDISCFIGQMYHLERLHTSLSFTKKSYYLKRNRIEYEKEQTTKSKQSINNFDKRNKYKLFDIKAKEIVLFHKEIRKDFPVSEFQFHKEVNDKIEGLQNIEKEIGLLNTSKQILIEESNKKLKKLRENKKNIVSSTVDSYGNLKEDNIGFTIISNIWYRNLVIDFLSEKKVKQDRTTNNRDIETVNPCVPNFITNEIAKVIDLILPHIEKSSKAHFERLINDPLIEAPEKVYFLGKGNVLSDCFKRLFESDIITGCDKSELIDWQTQHFTFRHKGKETHFKRKTVEAVISGNQNPCKNPLKFVVKNKIIENL